MKNMVFICLFFAIIVTVYADMTWTESFSDYENSLSTYQDSIFYRFSYLGVGGKTYEIGTPELPVKITNLIIRRDEQVDSITRFYRHDALWEIPDISLPGYDGYLRCSRYKYL